MPLGQKFNLKHGMMSLEKIVEEVRDGCLNFSSLITKLRRGKMTIGERVGRLKEFLQPDDDGSHR